MMKLVTLTALGALAFAPAFADTLKIGVATAQTGGLAPYDSPVIDGLHIAVDELNAAGGIGGKTKIELIEKDVRSDAAQTSIAAQELIDSGADVLVLPCDADPALAAMGIITSAEVPAISTCASSPTLPMIAGDYMFANFPGDNVQATVSATWAKEQGFDSAYVIYSPDSQYTTMPLYFKEVFENGGGEVLGEDTYSIGQQDFSAIATRIASLKSQPDVIMTSAYEPDFPSLLKALRAAGVKSQVIGSDGIDSPTTFSLGAAGEGVVFTTAGFALKGSPLEAFNKKFEAITGKPTETVFNAIGYDLIKVLEAAVLSTDGSTEPKKLRDAIASLENVQGATSTITYKGTDGMPVRQVSLIRVTEAKREYLGSPSPDAALIPAPRMQ